VTASVSIDPRARRAYGVPGVPFPVGAVIVGLDGHVVRVRADGGLEAVMPGGLPRAGIASDPTAARRGARP
jgi:hypothetical protein